MNTLFTENDALVFVCACGIAVREIADSIKSKQTDPAVIVIDDKGRYVIPILSGHIGGANSLSKRIASLLDATAIITTATDSHGLFSCDGWASEHNCVISSLKVAKEISAAILETDVSVSSEYELPADLPGGLVNRDNGEIGIYIGIKPCSPYSITLNLIPRVINVGVGCRRDTPKETILSVIKEAMDLYNADMRSVKQIASIDVKKDETGILECAKELNVPVAFFSAEQLNSVKGDFEESEFVKNTVGTGNVCERSAVLAGGELVFGKYSKNGVTVALSKANWRIEF